MDEVSRYLIPHLSIKEAILDRRVKTVIGIISDVVSNDNNLPGHSSYEYEDKDGVFMEKLAQSVNLSPSRLRSLFKSSIGMTPAQYLKILKLHKAKELAENTYMTIGEILAKVGISGDKSHFLRDFKKAFGITLTDCRNLCYQHLKERQHGQNNSAINKLHSQNGH
jgi:AraC-like DNA-binding protein